MRRVAMTVRVWMTKNSSGLDLWRQQKGEHHVDGIKVIRPAREGWWAGEYLRGDYFPEAGGDTV